MRFIRILQLKHTQSGLFPVKLQDVELNWMIILNYTALKDAFFLAINGASFPEMPLQTEVIKEGHQNIIWGVIMLNGEEVHSGFVQYTADTFDEIHSVIEYDPITEIEMIDWFKWTSSDVLNSVIDYIRRAVEEVLCL